MEMIKISNALPDVSRVALGTWAMGGWMWGGTDDSESEKTILKAVDLGINIIDTAPVYGFGRSEEVVGQALAKHGLRNKVVIATKAGLEWQKDGRVFRNAVPQRILKEVEDSLKRLKTDVIDLYQVHWPDELIPIEETARAFESLLKKGMIKAIGVSNYSVKQMEVFSKITSIATAQPPYNLFERGVESEIFPYCEQHGIATLAYGALCRGMLSGKMTKGRTFEGDDLRNVDPKFQSPRYDQYLAAVAALDQFAKEFNHSVIELAVRWLLDRGKVVALWGARHPDQLSVIPGVSGWKLDASAMKKIDDIIATHVKDPIGPEFMGSPHRNEEGYLGENPV